MTDATYWTGAKVRPCVEALTDVHSVVDYETDPGLVWDHTIEELGQPEQEALLDLFMFATDLFAATLSVLARS